MYLLEIRQESGGVHLHKLLPFGGSGTGSASEILIGENNHWFVDGVDTGIPATGTVEITQILTGEAGSSATLTEASGSTASAKKYTLTVPRGAQGNPGYGSTNWVALTYAASVLLSGATGDNQKITLTGDINLTAPTLSATYPTLLLQIATGGYAVSLGGTPLIEAGSSLTYLIGWYFDGESTKRLSVSEVAT